MPRFNRTQRSRNCGHRFLLQRGEKAFKNPFAVVAAEDGLAGAFGMRHEARHVALFIADAGDVVQRAVWVGASVGFASASQYCQRIWWLALISPVFPRRQSSSLRRGQSAGAALARGNLVGEGRIGGGVFRKTYSQRNCRAVADQRAGQQAGFGEHLKAVADAQHQAAVGRRTA